MNRNATGKTLILLLATLIAGIAPVSCSGDLNHNPGDNGEEQDTTGSVGVRLQVAPGVLINTITWTISGNGLARTGTFDVTGAQTTFTGLINDIPAGTGYTVTLTTPGEAASCSGSATFDVIARSTTGVQVHLECRGTAPTTGNVVINGDVNFCPFINSVTALPLTVAVGSTSQLGATATDADNAPSPLTYLWTLPAAPVRGTLAGATTATPVFTATAEGTTTVTLVVSDGDCQDTIAQQLIVVAASSGGGSGGAGGTSSGGSGGTDTGGTSSGGTSSGGTGGTETGGTSSGGTGGVSSGGTSSGGTGGTGGSGTVDACLDCESVSHEGNTSCPDARTAGLALTGSTPALLDPTTNAPIAASGQTKSSTFVALLECIHSSHCASSGADSDCFCGIGVDPNDCFAATYADATGPCKELIAAAAESVAIGTINNHFNDSDYASGAAFRVIDSCDQFSCVDQCL